MHRGVVALVVLAVLAAGACSGGSKNDAAGKSASCAHIAQLDKIVAVVARADVSDPAAFNATLNDAVKKYVDTVKELKTETPASLQPDLDRLIAAVDQERFDDAATARASLDNYALTACGRPLPTIATPTSTSTSTPTTTPAAIATTTVPQ